MRRISMPVIRSSWVVNIWLCFAGIRRSMCWVAAAAPITAISNRSASPAGPPLDRLVIRSGLNRAGNDLIRSLSLRNGSLAGAGSDEMRDDTMMDQFAHMLLHGLVGFRHTMMLTQMLQP